MKTLLFTLEFPPFHGGVANYYGNLVNYWPLGEELLVLDNNEGKLNRGRGFLSWRWAYGALKRKVTKNKIDYVLVGQILPLGTVAWFLSLSQPLKYAVFLHGMDWTLARKNWEKKLLSGLILRRAAKIICANGYVADQVEAAYPDFKGKIALVNPGIASGVPYTNPQDSVDLQTSYDLSGKTVLFSLGRLVRRKGVDLTIKALEQIPEPQINNLLYFIAGTGQEESYLRQLVPARLTKQIIFLGELTEKEKWLWLKQADIFIMPARNISGDFEGFGIVYLEANLCEKPVIAGNFGGVRDAVVDNYNGLLVDPEKVDSIARAIIKLAGNPALRQTLGRQGRERAVAEFNWEKQTAKILDLIKPSL
jgi:phosphatidylinositol alpha-1,6-mannosyltransferase